MRRNTALPDSPVFPFILRKILRGARGAEPLATGPSPRAPGVVESGRRLMHDGPMAKPRAGTLPDLADLAVPGTEITLRVTPKAARNSLVQTREGLKAAVTAAPENGKANAAARALLARAMKVAPTRLELKRGATSRQKTFVYTGP